MHLSTNPYTKQQYPIPETINDRKHIEAFLRRFPERKVVVVQGLGFVGAVMSIVCANADGADYAVIGVDLPTPQSYWKICEINAGKFPITSSDPNVELYFENARQQGNFYATADPIAYSYADVIIVDVNLDVDKKNGPFNELKAFDVNLDGFRAAIKAIGRHCREDVHVIVETTVPPGTCMQVVYPLLCEGLVRRSLTASMIRVGHSYERVMPGPDYVNSIKHFYRVYAGIDEASADATEAFLRTIISTEKYPLTRLGNTNATEMAKVLENSYRAMNIAFIVEWTRFAEEAGVNLYEVVRAIRMRPTHSNMMLPGIGVGGYCLTKDALMASWARQQMFGGKGPLTMSEQGIATNDLMPWYAFRFMLKHLGIETDDEDQSSLPGKQGIVAPDDGRRTHTENPATDDYGSGSANPSHEKKYQGKRLKGLKFLLLGVSYRSDVADTRYTPPEYLYRFLKREGADVALHDPYVGYWEELALNVPDNLEKVLTDDIDVLVFSTMHGMYRDDNTLYRFIEKNRHVWVFDTLGIVPEEVIRQTANKRIRVLGRGDLIGG